MRKGPVTRAVVVAETLFLFSVSPVRTSVSSVLRTGGTPGLKGRLVSCSCCQGDTVKRERHGIRNHVQIVCLYLHLCKHERAGGHVCCSLCNRINHASQV